MVTYTLMSGSSNPLGAEVRIAKAPDEVLSLIAKHALLSEIAEAPEKREMSLQSLTNLLADYPEHITEESVSVIARAVKDRDDHVSVIADVCLILLSSQAPGKVFAALLREHKTAEGEPRERMSSTLRIIYNGAPDARKARFARLAGRHGFSLGPNVVPLRPPKPTAPQKPVQLRRVA